MARYLTIQAFAEQVGKPAGWPSEAALRHLVRDANENGLAPALRRVGKRRVLIDVEAWERWVAAQALVPKDARNRRGIGGPVSG